MFSSGLQSPLIAQIEYFAHQATLNIDKGASKLEKARQKKIKRLKVICRAIRTAFIFYTLIILSECEISILINIFKFLSFFLLFFVLTAENMVFVLGERGANNNYSNAAIC